MAEKLAELNKTDEVHISTTETVIGTYLGKPLYAKQFDCTSPSSIDTSTIVASGVFTSEMVMRNLYGAIYRGNGVENAIPTVYINNNIVAIWRRDNDIVMHVTFAANTNCPCSIVVEYTKTTD